MELTRRTIEMTKIVENEQKGEHEEYKDGIKVRLEIMVIRII